MMHLHRLPATPNDYNKWTCAIAVMEGVPKQIFLNNWSASQLPRYCTPSEIHAQHASRFYGKNPLNLYWHGHIFILTMSVYHGVGYFRTGVCKHSPSVPVHVMVCSYSRLEVWYGCRILSPLKACVEVLGLCYVGCVSGSLKPCVLHHSAPGKTKHLNKQLERR